MARYRKFIAATIGVLTTWGLAAWADGSEITRYEWIALATALATAWGVYQVPNDTS